MRPTRHMGWPAAQGSIRSGHSHLGLCTLLAVLPGDVVVTAQWLSRNRLHAAGMADKGHVGGVAMMVCQLVPTASQKDVKCLLVLLQRPSQEVLGLHRSSGNPGFVVLLRSGERVYLSVCQSEIGYCYLVITQAGRCLPSFLPVSPEVWVYKHLSRPGVTGIVSTDPRASPDQPEIPSKAVC